MGIFTGQLREAEDRTLEIREALPGAVEAMLRYIYTGRLFVQLDMSTNSVSLTDILASLLNLAMQYELLDLVETVAEGLSRNADGNNIKRRLAAMRPHKNHQRVVAH